jgi:DNA polymerase V
MFTMGDIALRSQTNEEWFYKTFGIDAEILIDHAWGIEPVRMCDIKNYKSDSNSLSHGQVLPRPYKYDEARIVFQEMIDVLCADMYKKKLITKLYTWWVSYYYKSLEYCPYYEGPLSIDYYGRVHPTHSNGTARTDVATNSTQEVTLALTTAFDKKTDHRLLYRRLGVCACNVHEDNGIYQLNLFTDYDRLEKERNIQRAMAEIRAKYGANAILKGINLLEGATAKERNEQIGGHRA